MPNNLLNVFFFYSGFFSSVGWGGGVGGLTLGGGLLSGLAAGLVPKKLVKSLGGGFTGFWFPPPIGSCTGCGFIGSTFTYGFGSGLGSVFPPKKLVKSKGWLAGYGFGGGCWTGFVLGVRFCGGVWTGDGETSFFGGGWGTTLIGVVGPLRGGWGAYLGALGSGLGSGFLSAGFVILASAILEVRA